MNVSDAPRVTQLVYCLDLQCPLFLQVGVRCFFMKLSLDKGKVSLSFSEPPVVPSCSFHEHHWDGPKRVHVPVWQPRQTTLLVVFDGESRHLFSTARILVYHVNGSPNGVQSGSVWDIQQHDSVIHALRGHVSNPPPNVSTLPKLTIAFEVVVGQGTSRSSLGTLVLRSPESFQELSHNSISVLLEHEHALTSDTLSLSLSFTHSTLLCTPNVSGSLEEHFVPTHPTSWIEHITTRILRVLPPASTRSRITNGGLPTELLIKTFKDVEFRHTWHDDLLSFAQVCRSWACAMDVLHARLTFSEDDRRSHPRPCVDVYALAKAVRSKPVLGHSFRHLTTDNFGRPADWEDEDVLHVHRRNRHRLRQPRLQSRFTAALISILGTTKHVQRVHLGQLDSSQSDALFAVLHELSGLQTLSLGPAEERPLPPSAFIHSRRLRMPSESRTRLLSVVQLARCLARWPALTSLKLHHVHSGLDVLGLWRLALRPPACTLTQLTLSRSHLADRDLAHLFAPSASALERVVLDRVTGVTNAGLVAFLRAIARTVVYLTVRDVALPPLELWGSLVIGRTERALDGVVHTMIRLCELHIGGDVASEFMLDRRSRAFVAQYDGPEEERVPVVRLWVDDVPRLCGFAADRKWPGWCTPGKAPLR